MKRKIKIALVLIVVIILISVLIAPSILRSGFENRNLEIVKKLNKPSTKEVIRNNMTRAYNLTELFDWEHSYVKWVPIGQTFDRSTDPEKILAGGKGLCGEFSILYLAACLSLGYEARFLVAVRPFTYLELHNWVEVKVNDQWIPVDPTDKVWNDASRYKDWWGKIGKDAFIYAFAMGKVEDVTENYTS